LRIGNCFGEIPLFDRGLVVRSGGDRRLLVRVRTLLALLLVRARIDISRRPVGRITVVGNACPSAEPEPAANAAALARKCLREIVFFIQFVVLIRLKKRAFEGRFRCVLFAVFGG
jgi:hypothetical protein